MVGRHSFFIFNDHLNTMNKSLQGKDGLVLQMCGCINSFVAKLQLFERQMSIDNAHFQTLQLIIYSFTVSVKISTFKCMDLLSKLNGTLPIRL